MSLARTENEETELQFYGFTISQFAAEHSTMVDIRIENLLNFFLTKLSTKLENPPEELMSLLPSLASSWKSQTSGINKNMESILNKYLAIPANVPMLTLDHRSENFPPVDQEVLKRLKADFDEQRQTFQTNKRLIESLQAELDAHVNLKSLHNAQMRHQIRQKTTNTSELQNIVKHNIL